MKLTNDAKLGDTSDFADRIASDTFVRPVVLRKHPGDGQSVASGRRIGAELEVLGRFDDLVVVEPLHDRIGHADDAALELNRFPFAYLAVLHRLHKPRRRVACRRRWRLSRHRLTYTKPIRERRFSSRIRVATLNFLPPVVPTKKILGILGADFYSPDTLPVTQSRVPKQLQIDMAKILSSSNNVKYQNIYARKHCKTCM